jgi:hypothetical protein
MSKTEEKKVIKKLVTIDGQKVPLYICPSGMSGRTPDFEKSFTQTDKEEAIYELKEDEQLIKEDLSFTRSYQRYCDEGEITSPEVEDFVYQRQATKHYDADTDREKDLVSIYGNTY